MVYPFPSLFLTCYFVHFSSSPRVAAVALVSVFLVFRDSRKEESLSQKQQHIPSCILFSLSPCTFPTSSCGRRETVLGSPQAWITLSLHMDVTRWSILKSAEDGEALYSQQKQDWELAVAQIMNSLLPNSDLN